jgi:signal transduction histidine kinase/DNA-binding NarL/FixJ family response regulator/streptogramin lyase
MPHQSYWTKFLFALVFFSVLRTNAYAQSVRILSTQDGLPQSFISGLVQDDDEFVWIGTRNGLARFDGSKYKVFQHDQHDRASIASNVILGMKKDRHNRLWLEFESGQMDALDMRTERITHFMSGGIFKGQPAHFVGNGWMVDRSGNFWNIQRGAGLSCIDSAGKTSKHYTHATDGLPSDTIRGLLEDHTGIVWVLSQRGISRFDSATNTFHNFAIPYEQDFNHFFSSEERVVDLHERQNGEIMWGDCHHLYFLEPKNRTFRRVDLPDNPQLGVQWIRSGPQTLPGHPTTPPEEYFERLGTVYRYDDTHGLTPVGNALMNNHDDARSFLVDHSSVVWIGTNAGGIHQIDLMSPYFHSYKYIHHFHQDLLQQEFHQSLVRLFEWTPKDSLFSPESYHFRSVYDRTGRLYMGLKGTVCYFDPHTNTFTRLPHVPLITDNHETGIALKGITMTPDGNPMVIGYNGHILAYDPIQKTWQPTIDPGLIRRSFGTAILPQDIVNDGKKLWITTAKDGLLVVDIATRSLLHLKANESPDSLPTNQLLGLLPDPRHDSLLWIASYQGLICFNKHTLRCEIFSEKEGLPDNTIYSLVADRNGILWFSTNKGICRFDPVTHRIRVFRSSYGLPGDEYNRFHHLVMPDGRLAFGGTEGWTIFDPIAVKDDDFEPGVAFTGLRVNNKDVQPSAASRLLPAPLNALSRLNLSYDQNTLIIEFAGLQYNEPQDLNYRYRLSDYDDGWVMAGHNPIAIYTKLPPGKYSLEINASNSSGRWSPHTKTLMIIVASPWWQSWWAWLCYILFAVGLVWAYIGYRIRQEFLRQEMSLKEKEALQLKELDEMKTRFFANVTHEFRTPLTLIMGPARQLMTSHPDDQQQTRLAGIIEKNGEQLLGLINQLMDLSKLEATTLRPTERPGRITSTIGGVVASFDNEAKEKNIQLTLQLPGEGPLDFWYSQESLERIVYNLLSNAFKFTPPGGTIGIQLTTGDDGVELQIKDTGVGIAADQVPFIFNRFYQAGPQAGQGTGIGLAFVKELVDVQEGKIEVVSRTAGASRHSSGTIFTVFLPYRPAGPGESPLTDGTLTDENDHRPLVLLVEDNEDLAAYIKDSLNVDYRVECAENGSIGLHSALNSMPDLIISDVLMPVMDGFELCQRLKSDLRTSHIPLILLTAKSTQEDRIEGLSLGANDYLTKPFHPTELLLRIHNLLEQQQRMRDRVREELGRPAPAKPPATTLQAEVQADQPAIIEDPFLIRIYQVVEDHLDDSLFGVDEFVRVLDMSRTSLHRKIKALTNLSTTELVRNYRLKKATQFLRQGHTSTETAYLCGFSSPAYFTKCFRELYQLTPGEFIQQNAPTPHL